MKEPRHDNKDLNTLIRRFLPEEHLPASDAKRLWHIQYDNISRLLDKYPLDFLLNVPLPDVKITSVAYFHSGGKDYLKTEYEKYAVNAIMLKAALHMFTDAPCDKFIQKFVSELSFSSPDFNLANERRLANILINKYVNGGIDWLLSLPLPHNKKVDSVKWFFQETPIDNRYYLGDRYYRSLIGR